MIFPDGSMSDEPGQCPRRMTCDIYGKSSSFSGYTVFAVFPARLKKFRLKGLLIDVLLMWCCKVPLKCRHGQFFKLPIHFPV